MGVAKSAKMSWWLPYLNSCHGHKLGRNSKMLVSIRQPMTKRLFLALKMSKKLIPGPSYGRLKKSCGKIWYSMRGALFKRPPQAQFFTKSKNFCGHQLECCSQWLFWALTFFNKVITIKVNLSLFLAFTVLLPLGTFFCHFLSNPPFENLG